MKYLQELRAQLGGSLPQRRRKSAKLEAPKLEPFKPLLDATGRGARDLDHDGVRAHADRRW